MAGIAFRPLPRPMAERFDRWIACAGLVLVGLMWSLPFLQPYHRYPLTSFHSEWLAFVLGLAALAALARRGAWREACLPAVALVPLGLALLVMLQAALGRVPYFGQALTAAFYLAWAAALMFLGGELRRSLGLPAVAVTLAWCVIAGGELNAFAGLLQYYRVSTVLDPLIARASASTVFGNLAQANHFADYVALALASLTYLYAIGRLRGVAAAVSGMPLIFVLGLSGSRSAWLYLAAVFILALLFRRRRSGLAGERLLRGAGLVVVGFALAQWLVTLPGLMPTGGAATATERLFSEAAGFTDRLQLWREAWWMFLQAPMLGVGWGQFAWQHFEFHTVFSADAALRPYNHAHNVVLQLLAETGLAGALLVVGGALLWLRGLRAQAFELEHWWLLALLAVIGVHSLLEHPLWYSYFLGIAAIALGAGGATSAAPGLQRVGPIAVALMMAAGALGAAGRWNGYRDFEQMLFIQGQEGSSIEQVRRMLSRAQRDPVLEPYAELAISFGIKIDPDQLRAKLELNGRVMRFAPFDAVVYRQAFLLALADEHENARRQLARAARVYPADLSRVVTTLRELVVRYPAQFAPLLETATAELARLDTAARTP